MTENPTPQDPERPAGETAETQRMTAGDPLASGAAPPAADPAAGATPPPVGAAPPPAEPPPPPPPGAPPGGEPPKRRLLRSRDDRVLAGVAGGLAAYFAVDAVIVRLALIALTFFGGAGALLYLAAILLVPSVPPGGAAAGAAPQPERSRALTVIGIVVLVLIAGPLLLGPAALAAGLLVPLAFLVLAGVLVTWLVTGSRPGRDARSLIKATVLGLGVLLALGALATAAFWVAGLGGAAVAAGLVIVAGIALIAGAFARPVRWLILPALAIALPTAFVAAAGIELDGGLGEKTYRPGSAAELLERYEVGAGQLVVDLRGADLPGGDRPLDLEVGMGEAVLIVPEDVCVATDARVGMGLIEVFSRDSGGVDVDVDERASAPSGTTRLVVDADVGLGHFEVRHTDLPTVDEDDRGPRFDRFDEDDHGDRGPFRNGPDRDLELDPPGNTACTGAPN